MSAEAVLIHSVTEGNKKLNEASGILFSSNLVLSTGFILNSFISNPDQKEWIKSLLKSTTSRLEKSLHFDKTSFLVVKELKGNNDPSKIKEKKIFLRSKIVGVWTCPLVYHSLETLFGDWTIGFVNSHTEEESIVDAELSKQLISLFLVLKCENRDGQNENDVEKDSSEYIHELFRFISILEEPKRGQEVKVVSTPFGLELLLNSFSRGIISNVIGNEKCLILTDARTVSGCEGGPIFAAKKLRNESDRKLIGLVGCPLTWCRGEWVGLTIGISLTPVLRKLLQNEGIFHETLVSPSMSLKLDSLPSDEIVVLIRSETTWGSGVIIDAPLGIIITCSHVVGSDKKVYIFYKNNYVPGSVVFKSTDGMAYDLAIVKVNSEKRIFKADIKITCESAKCGEVVIAAGFPFFSERDDFNLRPSLVCGCVARVNPFMIQTTCCIQSGFSGGALLRDGQLLGIIICNTKDFIGGALFPHINFAVPSSVFKDCVLEYIKTADSKCLEKLESSDPAVQSLWAFQTSKF